MTKDEIMNDVEMEGEDSSETKETENDVDVDVDVDFDGMEDETMNDVVDMDVEDTETKEDVMNVDLLLDLLKASKKAGEEIADKHVLLQIGLTGAGKVSNALNCDICIDSLMNACYIDTYIRLAFSLYFDRRRAPYISLEQNSRKKTWMDILTTSQLKFLTKL
jgi:hypothetical protein